MVGRSSPRSLAGEERAVRCVQGRQIVAFDYSQPFGHAVIHPQMMELLLARGEIGWRFEGNSLVGWDSGPHAPAEVTNRLQLLQQVVDQVPPYVWRDYAGVDPRQRVLPRLSSYRPVTRLESP